MDVICLDIFHFKHFATFIVLILVIPLATCLSYDNTSFSFPSIDPSNPVALSVKGDAYSSNDVIQLSKDEAADNEQARRGRAIYAKPVRLWDKTTGNLADFTTNFSFAFKGIPDGMAFFLAPCESSFPTTSTRGDFGLGNENTTSDRNAAFVAVEFDSYHNSYDPRYEHIGIDINSLKSSVIVPWRFNFSTSGVGKFNASILYSSTTQTLGLLLTNGSINVTLVSTINMSEYLPEWVEVGFSATTYLEAYTIYSWEFTSSLQVPDKDKSKPPAWVLASIGAFLFMTIVLGSTWFFWCSRKKKNKRDEEEDDDSMPPMDEEFEKVAGPRKFSYSELAIATNNFADQRLLGEGGFGKVFEGFLSSINSNVAIKRVTPESRQGIKEFATEVLTISQLRHKNLVQLIGWCHQKKELLLIYEFMTNGSLDSHLFKGKSCLMWETRHKIAEGLALALLYLHEEWERCVVHRDIKTSNIMLDSNFNTKLGDFGLARLVDHAKGSQTTVLAGTMGYMAPECVYTGKASKESDIYSFGVVVLEIVCGRRVVEPQAADGNIRLVDWVWELYGFGKLIDAVDPKLEGNFEEREIECLMIVGLWCAHPDYKLRPTIKEAISVLNFETSPPILPSKLPIPTYLAPPANMSTLSLISSYNSMAASERGDYTSESSFTTMSKTISSSSSSSLILNAQ